MRAVSLTFFIFKRSFQIHPCPKLINDAKNIPPVMHVKKFFFLVIIMQNNKIIYCIKDNLLRRPWIIEHHNCVTLDDK